MLLRAEKTAEGMKGIYVSLNEGDVASYRVTLDAEGKELHREPLRRAGGQVRIAPPADSAEAGRGGPGRGGPGRGGAGRGGPPPGATLPMAPPDGSLHAGEWNRIEIFLDANIVRAFLNDGWKPRAAWRMMPPGVTAPWRCTSAARARCVSKTSPTRIWD